jgi:hypothetical protein
LAGGGEDRRARDARTRAEVDSLLWRIHVCDRALARIHAGNGGGRSELEEALHRVRAAAVEWLRELGYPVDDEAP